MENRGYRPYSTFLLIFLFSLLAVHVGAYTNYTVGDALGWYDSTEVGQINYQKWAAGKNFSLGDFLVFNTDTNHSIVQTYNFTTYESCDYNDALDNDTIEWSSADPSNTATQPVTVDVPLLKEGMTYFLSGDYDGDQCKNGQRFQINVTYGEGLPESLKSPSEQALAPNSRDSGDDESTPDTIVSPNFDHPQQQSDNAKEQSGAVSLFMQTSYVKMFIKVLLLLGILYLFS